MVEFQWEHDVDEATKIEVWEVINLENEEDHVIIEEVTRPSLGISKSIFICIIRDNNQIDLNLTLDKTIEELKQIAYEEYVRLLNYEN